MELGPPETITKMASRGSIPSDQKCLGFAVKPAAYKDHYQGLKAMNSEDLSCSRVKLQV